MVAHLVADTRLTEFWALVDSVGSFGELADDARSEPLMGDRLTRPMPHARNALNDSLKGLAASLGRLFRHRKARVELARAAADRQAGHRSKARFALRIPKL